MLRELISAAVLAIVLLGIWQLGALRDDLAGSQHGPLALKMQEAERIVMYRFDADHGPVFHLDGDEVELRLISHLVLAPGHAYDPLMTYDYGLELRIDGPEGAVLWEQAIYTSTRQSKQWIDSPDGAKAGGWIRENAFSLEQDAQITDDRMHLITLPKELLARMGWGCRLHVTLDAPAASHGLVRAYERARNTSLGSSLGLFAPAPREEERLIGRLTYLPWDDLTLTQQRLRLRQQWDRLSALGELGDDYDVETIYYTGFRSLPQQRPPPPPPTLVADRATALTAWGPGELRLWVHADCSAVPATSEPSIELWHLDAAGVVDERHVEPCGAGATYDRWLPPGPHTVHVRGRDLPTTMVEAWFDDHLDPQAIAGLEAGRPYRPIVTRSPRVRLGPGLPAAAYALVEPDSLESAMLLVRARLPVAPGSDAGAQVPATIHYAFHDRHDQILEQGEWRVEPTGRLEAYEFVVDASDPERQWWVGDTRQARFIAPEGTTGLRLTADAEVIASAHVYWAGDEASPQPRPPYDRFILVGTRWRRIPIDHRRWHRIEPHNWQALQRTGQATDLHGPIRLELRGDEDDRDEDEDGRAPPLARSDLDPAQPSWVSLVPHTRHERRTVLARTEPGSPWARYSRWRPGRSVLTTDDDWGARALVLVDGAPDRVLGKTLVVTIDGQELRHPILSTRDRIELPGLSPGAHVLELREVPPGVRIVLDRPDLRPERGRAEQYRVISLHRLDGHRMDLRVDKAGPEGEYVNAVVIRCGEREASQLRVELDEGAPRRRRGVPLERVTQAIRERQLPATGEPIELIFLDREQARCRSLGRVPIPLGPDLEAGRHQISLRLREGPAVWVRFFRQGTEDEIDPRTSEWTESLLDLRTAGEAP